MGGDCGRGLQQGRRPRQWAEFVHVKNGSQLDSAGLFFGKPGPKTGISHPIIVVLFSIDRKTFPDFLDRLEFPLCPALLACIGWSGILG